MLHIDAENNFRVLVSLQTVLFCPRPFFLLWTPLRILVKTFMTMPVRILIQFTITLA
jgi:hypothetical protein